MPLFVLHPRASLVSGASSCQDNQTARETSEKQAELLLFLLLGCGLYFWWLSAAKHRTCLAC